ncbi:hypothetical protein J6590_078773 [Homalodisca vitripennis]|nr:hypothetical protein J6590_078773 [Homalodisca vitripennis]
MLVKRRLLWDSMIPVNRLLTQGMGRFLSVEKDERTRIKCCRYGGIAIVVRNIITEVETIPVCVMDHWTGE